MYGFIESEYDPRDLEFVDENDIKTEDMPSSYNYTEFAKLKIMDQGSKPVCVPTSISTMLDAMGYDIEYDINSVYDRRPEPKGEGMQIRDALKILKNDINDPYFKYYRLRNHLQMKWSIVSNGPCILALPVRSMNNEFWKGSEDLGGHAVACVGYDEEGFIIQNSWGSGWGLCGMTKLPYDQLKYVIEAWGII